MLRNSTKNKRRICLKGVLTIVLALILSIIIRPEMIKAYDEVVIVIDPGHGGDGEEDSYTGAKYHDLKEKDINLVTATALYEELSQYGNLKVYLTRTEDKALTLEERVDYAASVGADMLISVHYNASAHHRFYGSEIFTSAYGEEYAAGYSLASNIMNWWVEDGSVSKGIKTRIGNRGDYYGLIRIGREKSIPTIILEHGYLDNDNDFNKLSEETAWKHMGVLDATAIADYYGVKKNVVAANVNREYVVSVPEDRIEPDTTPPTDVKVTIDAYDSESGLLTYTVSASDSDGKLMYYDFDTRELAEDEENGFMHLSVWKDDMKSVQGSYQVPKGYTGGFVARVYNAYELFTDSEEIFIPEGFLKELNPVTDNVGIEGTDYSDAAETLGDGAETADNAEADGDWNLTDALKNTRESEYDIDASIRKERKSNYIGMITAISVVILMLIASIVMAVKINIDKRNRKKGKNKNIF